MPQSIKRLVRLGSLLLFAAALTGCVYLRLLETKNQLADFDRNFRVRVEDRHFVLSFLNPVILSSDFIYLTKLNPSRTTPLAQGYRWLLEFRPEGGNSENVIFAMNFNADHRLASWEFSPLFLEMAPPAFLEASIRSLGKGKVDQGKQQLRVDPEDLPRVGARPPSRKKILAVLGPPGGQFSKNGMQVLKYRFRAEAEPVDKDYEERRLAEAKLYFDPATDELARMSSRFAGLKLSIDFKKLTGSVPEPEDKTARSE